MSRRLTPSPRRTSRRALCRVLSLFGVLCAASLALACVELAHSGDAEAAVKGVVDIRLERFPASQTDVDATLLDLSTLKAGWTRIAVDWSKLQPTEPTQQDPGYDEAYVDQLKYEAEQLQAARINVIVTLYVVPRWASNKELWNSPPSGQYPKGQYQPFYAANTGNAKVMDDYQATCEYLAETLGQFGVMHYECGNEPNLNVYQYPQARSRDAYYGPRTYLAMLKAFHAGVKAAGAGNVVIAGANSPRGGNDDLSTAPQRFAGFLKKNGAQAYFDAYSHHPYVTGGSKSPQPDKPPYSTRSTVTLYNIDQLLRLFPGKPFYITEYGYSTGTMPQFGYKVTPTQQATYLQKAYSMAAKHRQIKVMLWYLVKDTASVFTGLQSGGGARKPSWFAFAGGNSLTTSAPRSAKSSTRFTITGVLKVRDAGFQAGQSLQLQSRRSSRYPWKTVKSRATGQDGAYAFDLLRQSSTRQYRVQWPGVCIGPVRTVRTP